MSAVPYAHAGTVARFPAGEEGTQDCAAYQPAEGEYEGTHDTAAAAAAHAMEMGGSGEGMAPLEGEVAAAQPLALFKPEHFRYCMGAIASLWIAYLLQVLSVASTGWASMSYAGDHMVLGLWNVCDEGVCFSFDTLGSFGLPTPDSLYAARAFCVLTLIFGSAALLAWLVLAFVHCLQSGVVTVSGGAVDDGGAAASGQLLLYTRKRRVLNYACGGHLLSLLCSIIACLVVHTFVEHLGVFVLGGSYSWCFALWVVALIVHALALIAIRFFMQ